MVLSPVWSHSGLILDHRVGYMMCLGWIWIGDVVVSSLSWVGNTVTSSFFHWVRAIVVSSLTMSWECVGVSLVTTF